MKKHNIFKVILITIMTCFVFTWILKSASYQYEFVDQGRVQMGLFDLFSYPLTSLSYFGYISLYLIVIGGFYGILYKIPAYRSLLEGLANKLKKKAVLSIAVIVILFALLTSICGLQLGLFLFFPFVASLILLMGYDKIVVALTLVGSTMVGMIGSTYAYNNTYILDSYLGTSIKDNIALKFALLIVGVALLLFNIVMYIKKSNNLVELVSPDDGVKNSESKVVDVVESDDEEPVKKEVKKTSSSKVVGKKSQKTSKATTAKKTTKKSKSNNKAAALYDDVIIDKDDNDDSYLVPQMNKGSKSKLPLIIGFAILFVIMVLAFIPWENSFGLKVMSDASTAVKGFKVFGFELFGKLLGGFNTFGEWMVADMILPIILIALLLSYIYRVKFDDVIDGFVAGAKKAMGPAVVSLLIYVVLIISTYHPFQLTIYKWLLGKGTKLNIVTTSIIAMLSSVLNVDSVYAFQASVPYLISVVTDQDVYPIIGVIYQSIYGITMLFAPTSVVLMTTLSYLNVTYKEWFKSIWKLLLELVVVALIIFTILLFI